MGLRDAASQPPKGWVAYAGVLEPDPTVAGCLARGEHVRGRCATRDCNRRCELDLPRLMQQGLGALAVNQAKAFLKCQRLDGCALDFHFDRRSSLPLRALFSRPHCRIRLTCQGRECKYVRAELPEVIWQRLLKAGKAQETLLISEIAALLKACPACGKTNWRVDVLWPDTQSEAWRRSQQAAE